jgi:hypothetical protein
MARWSQDKENEARKMAEKKRKTNCQEHRLFLKEYKMMQEIIDKKNRLMLMYPNGMDEMRGHIGSLVGQEFCDLKCLGLT